MCASPCGHILQTREPNYLVLLTDVQVMFFHTVYGVFFWEFFTTLDYEWRVIRGHIPYRWTIWIYSITRVAGLMGAILSFVGMDVATPLNCQLWISFQLFFTYLSLATASLLIVLRVIAIWNKNKFAMTMAIGVWGINVVFLIQGIVRVRAAWLPTPLVSCLVVNNTTVAPSLISMAITDIVLLLIMLVGLLRLRCNGRGAFGLGHLLWQQGVIWTFLATAAEVPPAVMIVLNLNDPLDIMLQVSAVVTMTVAATRMHRSLVDFTSRTSDCVDESFQMSCAKFSKATQSHTRPIPPNSSQITVHTLFEQDLARMSDRDLSVNADEEMREKPSRLGLDEATV